MMRIETERLILRRWKEADAGPLAQLHAHPDVAAWLGRPPADLAAARDYIAGLEAQFDRDGFGFWAIERRSDGALIGLSGLRRVIWDDHPMHGRVEMGWRQARDMWGQGYATEAAQAALRDGIERIGLTEVLSWTSADNHRSQAVMQRIGLMRQPELDFNHPGLAVGDRLRPHIVFSTNREAGSALPPGR